MVKHVALATCLLVSSLGAAASAQSLLKPAQGVCPAGPANSPAASALGVQAVKPLCGPICDTGFTTNTQSTLGGAGDCAAMSAALTADLKSIANASCQQFDGRNACSVVVHLMGCVEDGDPQYFIEYGYATYGCNDTTC